MSLPFFHKDHIDISNHLDFPGELLSLPASSENCILIIGPDLVRREAVPSQGHTHTYLEHLLKGMVVWCTQNKVIQDQDIIHDLHVLLHNGALVPLAYTIEEYLAAPQLKEQCLRAVLNPYSQAETIHYRLTRLPFRGYIITSYDTCIETAYEETQQAQLGKFYQSSLAQAVDTSRKKQPFILKLYGDLAEPDSIKLGHRLLTGLYAEDVRQQLRQLFFETPAIFIGFDDADQDLIALQSLITDEYDDLQKHSTHARDLHDDISTQQSDQPSPDNTTHEIFPGYRPMGPVMSAQNQDTTSKPIKSLSDSKDEQSEKETVPDATEREPVVTPASNGQYRGNGRQTGSPSLHSGSTSGSENQDDQLQNQTEKPSDSSSASALTNKAQVTDFQSLIKSGDLQLPDVGVLGDFKSFLKNECGDLGISVGEGKTPFAGKSKKYTRVTKEKEDPRALIYVPKSTMANPDDYDIMAIRGLCSVFSLREDLIICTDSDVCHSEIKRNLAEFKKQNDEKQVVIKDCRILLGSDIQYLLNRKNEMDMDKEEKAAQIAYLLY